MTAKIYNFQEILDAKNREDYLETRQDLIKTTIADIEEMVVEISTETIHQYMQDHLGLNDREITEWLLEKENTHETEKPNT
jgi:hypothetical protein